MLNSRFRFQKSANLYLFRSFFIALLSSTLFKLDALSASTMFLISTGIFLSKIYSQFFHSYEDISNLTIYEAKVFYNTNLENNGIEHNLANGIFFICEYNIKIFTLLFLVFTVFNPDYRRFVDTSVAFIFFSKQLNFKMTLLRKIFFSDI